MENFYRESTGVTPEVLLDKQRGQLTIRGNFCPHDQSYYKPIMQWLEAYLQSPAKNTVLNLYPIYINSFSAKYILKMFKELEQIKASGQIKVHWFYEDDEDIEDGEWKEFQDYTTLPISFIKQENLLIKQTKLTPKIAFNFYRGIFKIEGRVFPYDTFEFTKPIINWLENYFENPCMNTLLKVECEAISADSKFFTLIFNQLINAQKAGHEIKIDWYHNDDEDILEYGKDYEALTSLPFSFFDLSQ